jgi:hypothetical protein
MAEIISMLSAILAIIFSFTGVWTGFYICGVILLILDLIGVLFGGIKRPGRIIWFSIIAIAEGLIFRHNIFRNIIFILCVECCYTYIHGGISYLRLKREMKKYDDEERPIDEPEKLKPNNTTANSNNYIKPQNIFTEFDELMATDMSDFKPDDILLPKPNNNKIGVVKIDGEKAKSKVYDRTATTENVMPAR